VGVTILPQQAVKTSVTVFSAGALTDNTPPSSENQPTTELTTTPTTPPVALPESSTGYSSPFREMLSKSWANFSSGFRSGQGNTEATQLAQPSLENLVREPSVSTQEGGSPPVTSSEASPGLVKSLANGISDRVASIFSAFGFGSNNAESTKLAQPSTQEGGNGHAPALALVSGAEGSSNASAQESFLSQVNSENPPTAGEILHGEFLDLQFLNVKQLSQTEAVAKALSITPAEVRHEAAQAQEVVTRAFQSTTGSAITSTLLAPLATTLAGVSVKNEELSSSRGKFGFLSEMISVVGVETLQESNNNSKKSELLTETVASLGLGQPVERTEVQKEFPKLAQALYNQERQVIQDGVFQKMFERNPKSAPEWGIVKDIAYHARVIDRDIPREIQARERYEKVEHVNLNTLSQSSIANDTGKTQKAWSIIRVVASSDLPIPGYAPPATAQLPFPKLTPFTTSSYGTTKNKNSHR